jgi:ligand-binding SRPBCC domain-containing protein
MSLYTLYRELWVPHPLPEVFDFFSRAENLELLTPPWLRFRMLTLPPIHMQQGGTIEYALRIHGIPVRWLTEIEHWNPPYEFIDVQLKGPYRTWRHTHRFTAVEGGTSIVDMVRYELPLGMLGRMAHRLQVARDLSRVFDYRAGRVRDRFA